MLLVAIPQRPRQVTLGQQVLPADPNLEEINSQKGMTGEPTGVLALNGVTLSLGYREGELVGSVVVTLPGRPQPMCRALWTVLGNTHHLVAHLQVLLSRFAAGLGSQLVGAVSTSQTLSVFSTFSLYRSFFGGWGRSKNDSR